MKLNIIHKKGIIIILAMEGKEVIQEKIFTRGKIVIEVKAKVEVIIINIILNIAKINIEKKNMIQIVKQAKIYHINKNHIHHLIQSQIHHQVLLIQINLPYYIPIQ
jgi:hypothetical protein